MTRTLFVYPLLVIALTWIHPVRCIQVPGCQTVAPTQKNLTSVWTTNITVPAHPFGVVYSQQNDIAFVALNTNLGVLNTSILTPSLIYEIPLPAPYVNSSNSATGIALTHDGRHVLVTASSTALIIVDVAKAVIGSPDSIVGVLNGTAAAGSSAIEVTVTEDDQYAFVSQEYGSRQTGNRGTIEVFKLNTPAADETVSDTSIGFLVLGDEVVGTALSPDGRTLYATSETASRNTTQGSLSIIDVEILKVNPSNALIASAAAGCQPVRVIVSRDGQVVWVTARASNALLAFNASMLISNPNEALLASVQVGTSPVGLAFTGADETRILIADSNHFVSMDPSLYGNATAGITIVDVDSALQGGQANLGQIPSAGTFPREFALSPDGKTVLVSIYGSMLVQAIDVSTLP